MIADRLLARLTKIPGARSLWTRFPIGSVPTRVKYGIFDRPHYAYGVYSAADMAKRLGLDAIQVIEFGVAGGNGLVALERIAALISADMGIPISVCGFDTGGGMPPPADYRDLPHVWDQGFYAMDVPKLRSRLRPETELVLGNVRSTVAAWRPKAKIGFIAFDLDYYSSTKDAFRLFDRSSGLFLPRVYCYFDDLMWPEHALHNEFAGELCAIREFNEEHGSKKLCPIHMFRYARVHPAPWNDQMYAFHDFNHPDYCTNITLSGSQHRQLALRQ
jgi:hypothetical protein